MSDQPILAREVPQKVTRPRLYVAVANVSGDEQVARTSFAFTQESDALRDYDDSDTPLVFALPGSDEALTAEKIEAEIVKLLGGEYTKIVDRDQLLDLFRRLGLLGGAA